VEHHGPIVGGFGDDRNRPSQLSPVVGGHVRQQFDDGLPSSGGGGHALDSGVTLGQPGPILADKPFQLLVAADLALAGVVDHDLARPHGLQRVGIPFFECGEYCLTGSA
jgi:hypothetical protein